MFDSSERSPKSLGVHFDVLHVTDMHLRAQCNYFKHFSPEPRVSSRSCWLHYTHAPSSEGFTKRMPFCASTIRRYLMLSDASKRTPLCQVKAALSRFRLHYDLVLLRSSHFKLRHCLVKIWDCKWCQDCFSSLPAFMISREHKKENLLFERSPTIKNQVNPMKENLNWELKSWINFRATECKTRWTRSVVNISLL